MDVEKHQQSALPRAAPHSFWLPQSGQRVIGSTSACYNADGPPRPDERQLYQFSTRAKTSGATIVASDSMMNFGVFTASLPQVIFSLGSAPEYEP